MVAVMVDDKDGFTEEGLPVTVREGRVEIVAGFVQEIDKGLAVGEDLVDGFFEVAMVRGRFIFWPISGRPFHCFIVRVTAKVEDIPLGDADMFHELPKAIR